MLTNLLFLSEPKKHMPDIGVAGSQTISNDIGIMSAAGPYQRNDQSPYDVHTRPFTVLLATNKIEIADTFRAFDGWERLGYTRPIIVFDCEEAAIELSRNNVSAVAIALPTRESAKLHDRLHGMRMLFLEPVADAAALYEVLSKMSLMIERRNDPCPESAMLASIRDTFFNTLLDGLIHSEIVLRNRLEVMQLPISPDSPCVLYTLRIDGVDQYLNDVWQYGRARLQLALRKFLSGESGDMYLAISSIRAGVIRLICCQSMSIDMIKPEIELNGEPETNQNELLKMANSIVMKKLEDVSDFLELDLSVEKVKTLPGLTSLLSKG